MNNRAERATNEPVCGDAIKQLLTCQSVGPKHLVPPAPTEEPVWLAAGAALRAPDHQKLLPFRFVLISADATRRRILALLVAEGELCVCELMAALDDIQPKVSRHLSVIRDTGLASVSCKGTWICYRLAPSLPHWVDWGVMSTPGVVVDGKVVHADGIPARANVESWF